MHSRLHGIGTVHSPIYHVSLMSIRAEKGRAHVSCSNDLILPIPDQAIEREQAGGNIQHGPRWLLRRTWVHNRNAAIMPGKGERVPAGRKGHAMDPSRGIVQELPANGVKRQTFAPRTRLRTSINALDEARENPGMGIRRSCR